MKNKNKRCLIILLTVLLVALFASGGLFFADNATNNIVIAEEISALENAINQSKQDLLTYYETIDKSQFSDTNKLVLELYLHNGFTAIENATSIEEVTNRYREYRVLMSELSFGDTTPYFAVMLIVIVVTFISIVLLIFNLINKDKMTRIITQQDERIFSDDNLETYQKPEETVIDEEYVEDAEKDLDYEDKVYEVLSYEEKWRKAPVELKEFYNELKNYILKYNDISHKHNLKEEYFKYNKKYLIKFNITGKSFKILYSTIPQEVDKKRLKIIDVGNVKSNILTPYMLRITSKIAVRKAKVLIDYVMVKNEILDEETNKNINYVDILNDEKRKLV